MPIVIPSGSTPAAAMESLVLDGLALNDESIFVVEAPDGFVFNPAPKRQRWIQGEDADGAALAEPSRSDNATAILRLRVVPQGSMDAALAQIGKIADKLYEAEQQPDGIPLVWTPATGTKVATAYVLSGEITDLPFTPESGYWVYAPLLTVRFDCKPFMDGVEITNFVTAVTNSNPIQTITLPSVPGDVPAKARLVVTDAASQNRRHLEWGLQWRYYDAATSLQIDSGSLVTSGFGGTSTTRAGSFNTNVIRGTLLSGTAAAITGLGNLGHVGSFRVKARVYPVIGTTTTTDLNVRLSWREGDGLLQSNGWTTCPGGTAAWSEVDLGLISVPPKTLGTQRWTGQIEAYSTTTGDTVDIDYVLLIPTEAYGKARAGLTTAARSIVAHDEFTATTAGGALNARAAPQGGTWATSGTATGDFLFADAPGSDETVSRATTSDTLVGRFGILGSTNYTDTEVGARIRWTVAAGMTVSVVARWVDSSNWIDLSFAPDTSVLSLNEVMTSSASLTTATLSPAPAINTYYRLRLTVYANGSVIGVMTDDNGVQLAQVTKTLPSAMTGGALATGKPGLKDRNGSLTAATRYYDNFYAGIPASESVVAYSGRSTEIRSDAAIRQDPTGTYYGPIPSHRGAHFFVPPAGDENRTSRVLVKARRSDIDTAADANVTDSTTVAVHLTPRYSTVPR